MGSEETKKSVMKKNYFFIPFEEFLCECVCEFEDEVRVMNE
jgi:hypothetical protein